MKIAFLGDIVGRSGREVFCSRMPEIKERLKLDFIIVNAENAAGGFGITEKIIVSLFEAGADCVTTGNHAWDQRDSHDYYDKEKRILRPLNYPKSAPGHGAVLLPIKGSTKKVLTVNVMTRLFMDPLDDPFAAVDEVMKQHRLSQDDLAAIVVDVHGEATSEKMAMGNFLDGRASLVVGTHTHVPTADHQLLPFGTAYMTDAGMCGDYNSILGMQKEAAIQRFVTKLPTKRLEPALGQATLCGVIVKLNDQNGRAEAIAPLRQGPHLEEYWPEI